MLVRANVDGISCLCLDERVDAAHRDAVERVGVQSLPGLRGGTHASYNHKQSLSNWTHKSQTTGCVIEATLLEGGKIRELGEHEGKTSAAHHRLTDDLRGVHADRRRNVRCLNHLLRGISRS